MNAKELISFLKKVPEETQIHISEKGITDKDGYWIGGEALKAVLADNFDRDCGEPWVIISS